MCHNEKMSEIRSLERAVPLFSVNGHTLKWRTLGVHACCRCRFRYCACSCFALQVNVIQSLLRAILALRPLPPLPVDLLGALAVGFNAWHTVIPALEHQVRLS